MTTTGTKAPSVKDRSARALAAFGAGSALGVVLTLLGLWATPHVIAGLGAERFGLSRAMLDIFAYLSLIEFGLAGAARPVLAKELASNDPERRAIGFAVVLKAYWRATLRKAFVVVPLVLAAPFLLRTKQVSRTELLLGAAVLALTVPLTPSGAAQALLSAEQREYLNALAVGIQNVLITLLSVVFAIVHGGLAGQGFAQLVGTVSFAVVLWWMTRDSVAAARRARPSSEDYAHVLLRKLNLPTFLRTLVGRIALMSDRIIVASLVGGSAVTSFLSTQRLVDAAFPQVANIGNAAWPAMAEIHARGDLELFRRRLLEVTTTICGVSILFVAPVLVINEAFINLWLGPGLFAGWTLTLVACANLVVLALTNYWDWCFGSTTNIRAIVPLTVVSGIVNVAASLLLTWRLGPMGAALGTLVGMGLVVLPWEAALLKEQFGVSLRRLAFSIGRPVAFGAAYILACRNLATRVLAERWDSIALVAGLTALGWILLAWWTVFDPVTRDAWRGRAKRILGKVRRTG